MRLKNAQIREEMRDMFEQEIAPLRKSSTDMTAQGAVENLKRRFGDDVVDRNREIVGEWMQNDPEMYSHPDLWEQRVGMAIKAAEWDRQSNGNGGSQNQPPRTAKGQYAQRVYTEPGSSAAPPQAPPQNVDPALAALRAMNEGVRRDPFGTIRPA